MKSTDEPIYMCLRGQLVQTLVSIFPTTYKKYVNTLKNGNTVMYVTLNKALYGIMQAALMFYRKLVSDLNEFGFTCNPTDPCVANKIVNGEQLTAIWHVDDVKLSHKDPAVVTHMVQWFKRKYATLPDNTTGDTEVTRGKIHEFIGITLDFTKKGKVQIVMDKFIRGLIDDFSDSSKSNPASTPATAVLFQVRPDTSPL